MAWIESHQSLSTHRKTLKAARLLKCDKHKLIGHLHELWWWGLDNADDEGFLEGIERADIALAAQWRGDPETFAVVLIECGFMDVNADGDRLTLHDWWDYAGKLSTQRQLRKESNRTRQQRYRAGTSRIGHASVTRDVTGDMTRSNQPTVPNRTNPTVPTGRDDAPARENLADVMAEFGYTNLPEPDFEPPPFTPSEAPSEPYVSPFDRFWEAYPPNADGYKTGKPKAGTAYDRNVNPDQYETVIQAAKNYAKSDRVRAGKVMNAATWLEDDWPKWLKAPPIPARMVGPDGIEITEQDLRDLALMGGTAA